MTNEDASQVVVIGSSAGGINALSRLVATLPADFPAPIVLAQHLQPDRPSHLAEILERQSALPVEIVEDRASLRPGVVFVVPANQHVELTPTEIRIRTGGDDHPVPSIDRLLSTAARAFRDGTIAVILTGMGSDGAKGAFEVKQIGGTVVIQNPRTASYPQLPQSLSSDTVDFIEDLEEIGPLLYELVTTAREELQRDDEAALNALLETLHDRNGIDFREFRAATLLRRLRRRMVATGQPTIAAYARYAQRLPEDQRLLIASFLIKVTQFLRDPEYYEFLKTDVLPNIIQEARTRNNHIRIWSAGCATGEEPYSLAILLSEALGDEREMFHIRIFATDLDAEAVEVARKGVYSASAVEVLEPALLERYFTAEGNNFRVKKSIRNLTIFGQQNLGVRAPFPRIDLLVCRNVLIYFNVELQRRLLQLFAFSLRDGGYLALGKAETTTPLADFFAPENQHLKVFRRRGGRPALVAMPTADTLLATPVSESRSSSPPARSDASGSHRAGTGDGVPHVPTDLLLMGLPIGIVVVDRRYDVQAINGMAREFLGIHSPAIGDDLIHLVENVSTEGLKAAIDAAFREQEPPPFAEEVVEPGIERARFLEITCRSGSRLASVSGQETVVISISDVSAHVVKHRELQETLRMRQDELERGESQHRRLLEAHTRLLESNRDLTDINMDLHASNESFLAGNEELQSASEEVETLNEELQATNEELETLNEELQATVEELNTTNDDLQARSHELEELAESLEAERRSSEMERVSHAKILVAMGDAVIVVDGSGNVLLTNAAYDRLFGELRAGSRWIDEHGMSMSGENMPVRRAAKGESFGMQFMVEDGDEKRAYFEANGEPIQVDGHDPGGVVVIRDITDRSLRRMQDQFLATASHELRTPLTVVHGYLGMMQRAFDDETPARLRTYVDLALSQTRRMEELIADLLDAARLQRGRITLDLKPIDLVTVVDRAVQLAQNIAQAQTINFEPAEWRVPVQADAGRIEQVLLNLMTNAVTFAPEASAIDVRLFRENETVCIEVQDYGPGISPENVRRLFAPFFQADSNLHSVQNGLGLGLFISKELVAAHGGTIGVASDVGSGTTFTVRLPASGSTTGEDGSGPPLTPPHVVDGN